MRKLSAITTYILLIITHLSLFSQEKQKNWSLNGYISNMQTVLFSHPDSNWINDNLIHNRLNFKWYPNDYLSFTLEIRNRFIWGDNVKYIPGYANYINNYDGFSFLSKNLIKKQSFLFNSTVDRVILDFSKGNWNISLGRQRINWGRTFVWNPNDIFNSYSFFDFDYVEKPGSDALRIQYYTGVTSSVELVTKIDSAQKITAAGLIHLNVLNYDLQILAGLMNETDLVYGAGWEGNIKGFGFRGEFSYFQQKEKVANSTNQFLMSVSLDYTFNNSLFVQAEALYDEKPINLNNNLASQSFITTPLGAKNLGFSKHSWFAQISYPFNPLFNATVSFIYYPDLKGYFTGPSFSYSLTDNLDFSVFTQFFSINTGQSSRTNMYIGFLRIKYSF
ncbi:MAG: hypothetical protein GXO79_03830 [Chlorobi bacterium]|nr:hypothetical protein [Chlorobiota bacterium]